MRLLAPHALLARGWAADVRIDVDAHGRIEGVDAGPDASLDAAAERLHGPVVPGMPNVHSHAFQRAMAGLTGRATGRADDSFWTWRQAMYAFVGALDPDAMAAVAAQAYVEMLKAGYTSVAEFHYVHRDADGAPYADPAELARRVVDAAREAGIAMTLLPAFYAHGDFGGVAPSAAQRRFVHDVPAFGRLIDALRRDLARDDIVLGVAPHSLRAATVAEIAEVVATVPPTAPVHVHAAEQRREVEASLASCGRRPIETLLARVGIDARWCVVHATHATDDERRGIAERGAVVGLAPTTEADLGDGTFAADAFVAVGGRFGIGSDSNTIVDPFAELRQLEWSQRLARERRNVLAVRDGTSLGTSLWMRAARGGAQAVGRAGGAIAPGQRADLVVLDVDDDALAGVDVGDVLDAAIFGPCRKPVRDVMVGGRWHVRDGRHPDEARVRARFVETMATLRSALR